MAIIDFDIDKDFDGRNKLPHGIILIFISPKARLIGAVLYAFAYTALTRRNSGKIYSILL